MSVEPVNFPLMLGFDVSSVIGTVQFAGPPPIDNLHEYFIAPAYKRVGDSWEMIGYGLVHRKDLPTVEHIEQQERDWRASA